ncbi:hypothetical protein Tco_0184453 [Tanacetum coccineum]
MVTIHRLSQNTTQSKRRGFSQLKVNLDYSSEEQQDGKDKSNTSCHITDCHAGNPCVHKLDQTTKIKAPMIGKMDGYDWQERVDHVVQIVLWYLGQVHLGCTKTMTEIAHVSGILCRRTGHKPFPLSQFMIQDLESCPQKSTHASSET